MRSKVITISILAILVISGLSVFSQENEKAAKARKDLIEAQKNLTEAKVDSAADFENFKKEADSYIAENRRKIAKLRDKDSSLTGNLKKEYNKKVMELETMNKDLQKQIEKSVHTKTSKWAAFKSGFKQDMDETTAAIKNFGEKVYK